MVELRERDGVGSRDSSGIKGWFPQASPTTVSEGIHGNVSSGPPAEVWTSAHACVSNTGRQAHRACAWVADAEVNPQGGSCPGALVPSFVACDRRLS